MTDLCQVEVESIRQVEPSGGITPNFSKDISDGTMFPASSWMDPTDVITQDGLLPFTLLDSSTMHRPATDLYAPQMGIEPTATYAQNYASLPSSTALSSNSDSPLTLSTTTPTAERFPLGNNYTYQLEEPVSHGFFPSFSSYDAFAQLTRDMKAETYEEKLLNFSSEPTSPACQADSPFSTDDLRWEAITKRSHRADIFFLYGTITTHIYCRPSCASKRPDRERTQYFCGPDAIEQAERHHFRACKRCMPQIRGVADRSAKSVGDCLIHVSEACFQGESSRVPAIKRRQTLKQYSELYDISSFHFHRLFKQVSTVTPGEYGTLSSALVLQDRMGRDHRNNREACSDHLNRSLEGWNPRRARRALGNVAPHVYSAGFPGMFVWRIVAKDTAYGDIVVLYTRIQLRGRSSMDGVPVSPSSSSTAHLQGQRDASVLAVLTGEDAEMNAFLRAPHSHRDVANEIWLRKLIIDLVEEADREVQIPPKVIQWLRRVRILAAAKHSLEPDPPKQKRSRRSTSNEE